MTIKHYYYCWRGIKADGLKLSGMMYAINSASLKTELAKQGILVKSYSKKSHSFFNSKVTQAQLLSFFRQLATLLTAGISLLQAFVILGNNQTNLLLKFLFHTIKQDIENGLAFSEALHKHPQFFSEFICNLLACGELTGNLDTMLNKIVHYKELIAKLKRKLQKALTYPLLVLLIVFCVTIVLLVFVTPQFESLFISLGTELPYLTLLTLKMANYCKNYGLAFISSSLLFIYGFIYAKQRFTSLAFSYDRTLIKLPILGSALKNIITSRFARTLALCFGAGLSIIEALNAAKAITSNRFYAKIIEQIGEKILTGHSLYQAMTHTGLFSVMALEMIAIGEESGTIELMLDKIADLQDEEFNRKLDSLIILLEPIIMTVLSLIIGILVIAMYLPIFKLGSVV